MIITEEQKTQLKKHLPNYKEILRTGSFTDMLDELAMEITAAFDSNDNPTDRSREIERLYDALFYQNDK
ncbi:MAG: hypothetical protein ACOX62_01200 [Christensenellales bacterium]|jgi:hypothetical protein